MQRLAQDFLRRNYVSLTVGRVGAATVHRQRERERERERETHAERERERERDAYTSTRMCVYVCVCVCVCTEESAGSRTMFVGTFRVVCLVVVLSRTYVLMWLCVSIIWHANEEDGCRTQLFRRCSTPVTTTKRLTF